MSDKIKVEVVPGDISTDDAFMMGWKEGYNAAVSELYKICEEYANRKIDDDLFIMRVFDFSDKNMKGNKNESR